MVQVIQVVTFWSPNVGGHLTLWKAHFFPSQKDHDLFHLVFKYSYPEDHYTQEVNHHTKNGGSNLDDEKPL